MKYKNEPIIYTIDNYSIDVTNLFVNVDISDINEKYLSRYILSGETPHFVSLKLYDTSEYYWTILLLNGVVNPFEDWYMTQNQLRRYCLLKYKNQSEKPHHFYDIETGERLTSKLSKDMMYLIDTNQTLPKNISFKTNFEYEIEKNEEKKIITCVNRENILDFVNLYNERLLRT